MKPYAFSHALLGGVLTLCVCLPPLAAADTGARKPDALRTIQIKLPDGTVVERLKDVPAGIEYSMPDLSKGIYAWWDAVLEPRAMTALATLPGLRQNEGQNLSELVEPGLVRNWAEFMDPELALRWNAMAESSGFSHAMLRVPEAGIGRAHPLVRWRPRQGDDVQNTWKNAVSEGARRAMTGQQALLEWLTLPTPAPKANPWLENLSAYRY